MTQPSKGVSLSGVSLFGKVPSLTSCFYNNPYMFSIARVFAVANIDIAVHTSQVTAKVRNRSDNKYEITGKLWPCVRVCVCVHTFTHTATLLKNYLVILQHTICGSPTLHLGPCPSIGGSNRVKGQKTPSCASQLPQGIDCRLWNRFRI